MGTSTRIELRCTGCKAYRSVTPAKFAKGPMFCPQCGNRELVVEPVKRPVDRGD